MSNPALINKVKWVSSVFIIISMILTSANIYPLNLYVAVIPTLGWIWVSIQWRDNALVAMNMTALTIYLIGIINYINQ
jgi:hypothetical protein